MWKLYRKLLDENKLNEHVHTLKVEAKFRKRINESKEKIYRASMRLEQVMSDWTAMKQREKIGCNTVRCGMT